MRQNPREETARQLKQCVPDYDTMSAHDLVMEAARIGRDGFPLPCIESALRKAVIREASVGTVSIKEKDPVEGLPLIDDLMMTRCEDPFAWVDYDLIPKET